jgi:putative transposase
VTVPDLSMRNTERLAEAGLEPLVGSVGDTSDTAFAAALYALCTPERAHREHGATGRIWK